MIEYENISKPELIEEIIKRGNGSLNEFGAIEVKFNGFKRTLDDCCYVVFDSKTENAIDWTQNNKISEYDLSLFKERINGYLTDKEVFIQNINVGNFFRLPIKITATNPYHVLYAKTMYEDLSIEISQYNIYFLPDFSKEYPKIVYDIWNFNIYICGTSNSDELPKAINFLLYNILPDLNVLPLKCMAHCNENNTKSTLFINCQDVQKQLILNYKSKYIVGGDNHQWSDAGLFGTELGIKFDKSYYNDNEIKNTSINKFGSLIENEFDAVVPLNTINNYIKNGSITNPNNIIMFIEEDVYEEIHQICSLTKEQAFYFYLLLNSNESYPQNNIKYANMFYDKLKRHEPKIWLMNTAHSSSLDQKDLLNLIILDIPKIEGLRILNSVLNLYRQTFEKYIPLIKNKDLIDIVYAE